MIKYFSSRFPGKLVNLSANVGTVNVILSEFPGKSVICLSM